MANSICTGCKFAIWDLNKAGALHPSGHGKCTWSIEVPIAGSAHNPQTRFGANGGVVKVEGGHIWRGQDSVKTCLTKEAK